jgi:hypothetical protein
MSGLPDGATYNVDGVEPFHGAAVVIHLSHEPTGATQDERGLTYEVRVTLPEVPRLIEAIVSAYSSSVHDLLTDLAAGGCRTCSNERAVGVNKLAALLGGDGGGEPCPVCIPRARKRIRDRVSFPRKDRTR